MKQPEPATTAAKPRSVTKDVARLAGVSTATVSRVLNHSHQVEPATRERVLAAAAKLKFVPHGSARSLRSQRSKMVGAIVPSFDYALYARTTSALQQRLDESGYSLVLAEHHYDLSVETRIAGQLLGHAVDAFVLVGVDHQQSLFSMMADFGLPYVLTWGIDPVRRHPSVGFDNRAPTYLLAKHLISLGHQRIGLLSAPVADNDRARARGEGLRTALAESALTLNPSHVAYAPISLAAAEEAMHRLLAQRPRPTAVVATNDVFAVGAMMACRKAGVRIPQDISITGVDNTDLGATQVPGLTGVSTPIREIGRAAAEQLLARLEGLPWDAFREFPVEIVHRGSTAKPRSG